MAIEMSAENVTVPEGYRPTWMSAKELVLRAEGHVFKCDLDMPVFIMGNGTSAIQEAVELGLKYRVNIGGPEIVVESGKVWLFEASTKTRVQVSVDDAGMILRHFEVRHSGVSLMDKVNVAEFILEYRGDVGWVISVSINFVAMDTLLDRKNICGPPAQIIQSLKTGEGTGLPRVVVRKVAADIIDRYMTATSTLITLP